MGRPSLAGFALGAVAGAATTAVLTTGTFSTGVLGSAGSGPRPGAPAEAGTSVVLAAPESSPVSAALASFEDCDELRRWYVEAALPEVGPWGLGRTFPMPYAARAVRSAGSLDTSTSGAAVGSSGTGTNVQEAGVDEPDTAKTDGRLVVRVARHHLVVTDVTGRRAHQRSRIELPGRRQDLQELLLVGDTVLLIGQDSRYRGWEPFVDAPGRALPYGGGNAVTHLTRVDLSDPGAPRVESHQRVDGALVSARQYGDGTVRVVVHTGYPELDFVHPNHERSRREATRLNRQVVRDTTIEDWLPGVRRGDGQGPQPMLDCADVRHPRLRSGLGTTSVLTLDPHRSADPVDVDAVTAAGQLVYSSADRLYVATLSSRWWAAAGDLGGRQPHPQATVHAFALEGRATTYRASGSVPGGVRDRWSFDENGGLLRVATALGRGWRPRENAVSVLEEDGPRLRVVGSVAGLGEGENIESVRWFDDLAVVVTFRQTDPLYTVDLSSPRHPRLAGALKIRGFSSYLHPVGGDLLLGLGQHATRTGSWLGAQVASFDLADTTGVTRLDVHGFGRATELAVRDPRAFSYLPDQRLALVVVEHWRTGRSTLEAFQVGSAGALHPVGGWPLSRWYGDQVRTLPLDDGRVAVMDRQVRIVDVAAAEPPGVP